MAAVKIVSELHFPQQHVSSFEKCIIRHICLQKYNAQMSEKMADDIITGMTLIIDVIWLVKHIFSDRSIIHDSDHFLNCIQRCDWRIRYDFLTIHFVLFFSAKPLSTVLSYETKTCNQRQIFGEIRTCIKYLANKTTFSTTHLYQWILKYYQLFNF